ncbi:MAG: hypothetical protein HW380_3813, partial [Magnetococcales bacterium]|nr:hypothetical protein [Magnetococcales bacterium]
KTLEAPPPNLRRGENLPPDPRNTFKEKKAGGLNGYLAKGLNFLPLTALNLFFSGPKGIMRFFPSPSFFSGRPHE